MTDKEDMKLFKESIDTWEKFTTFLFFAFKDINERLSKVEVVE